MFACARLRLSPEERLLKAEFGPKAVPPQIAGLVWSLEDNLLFIERLWVPRRSRAKTLSFYLYQSKTVPPTVTVVAWEGLDRGRYGDVELEVLEVLRA